MSKMPTTGEVSNLNFDLEQFPIVKVTKRHWSHLNKAMLKYFARPSIRIQAAYSSFNVRLKTPGKRLSSLSRVIRTSSKKW